MLGKKTPYLSSDKNSDNRQLTFAEESLFLLRRCNIELEVYNVSILDDISLALLSILPSCLDWPHGLLALGEVVEILVRHNFGLDEAGQQRISFSPAVK